MLIIALFLEEFFQDFRPRLGKGAVKPVHCGSQETASPSSDYD